MTEPSPMSITTRPDASTVTRQDSSSAVENLELLDELWDQATRWLAAVSIVFLLVYLVVMLAAYATGSAVLDVVAIVLAAWALLALLATHAADTQCQVLPWRLINRRRGGGGW